MHDSSSLHASTSIDLTLLVGRPDVLTHQTDMLTEPARLAGTSIADLFAKTTGIGDDFVVKLIDVYPEGVATDPVMSSYQLAISLDIFRAAIATALNS